MLYDIHTHVLRIVALLRTQLSFVLLVHLLYLETTPYLNDPLNGALSIVQLSPFLLFQKNKCMRIKILGDCYYCVAGAPYPDPDHAKHSIQMGLDMIDLISDVRYIYGGCERKNGAVLREKEKSLCGLVVVG